MLLEIGIYEALYETACGDETGKHTLPDQLFDS